MMRGYVKRDWAVLRPEMLGVFRHTDSLADWFVYTRQYLQQLCATLRDSHRGFDHADFRGLDPMESLRSFLRMFNHIRGEVTECRMMSEYERTEMQLCALPKKAPRQAIIELDLNPLEPSKFNYGKLHI